MVLICKNCKKGRHRKCSWIPFICSCECRNFSVGDCIEKTTAIIGGATATVVGLGITIGTVGLAAPVGGAIMGAGISSTFHGIEKFAKREQIHAESFYADVGLGAATGALTGGVGAIGEVAATQAVKQVGTQVVKAGVTKLAVRTAAGAAAGVAAKALDETKQCMTGEKEWSNYGKSFDESGKPNGTAASWLTSAAVGGLGGVGSHVSSNAARSISSGVTKSVTRVAVSGATAVTGDAVAQVANIAAGNQKEYDVKRTVKSAAVSTITAAACEGVKKSIYEMHGGKDQMVHNKSTKDTIDEQVPKEHRKSVYDAQENLNKIDPQTLEQQLKNSARRTNLKNEITKHRENIKTKRLASQNIKQGQKKLIQEGITDANKPKMAKMNDQLSQLHTEEKSLNRNMKIAQTALREPSLQNKFMNTDNAHYLDQQKQGQIACDINTESNGRGASRMVFDHNPDAPPGQQYVPSSFTNTHDYSTMPDHGKSTYYNHRESNLSRLDAVNSQVIEQATVETLKEGKKKKKKE